MNASNLLDQSYKTLKDYSGKFSDTYSFNFEQPKIVPTTGSLIGDFWINSKTAIGIFKDKYLLVEEDEQVFIKLPADKKDNKYYFKKTEEDITSSDTNYITLDFNEFVDLLGTPKLLAE